MTIQRPPTQPADSYFGRPQPGMAERFMWLWKNNRLNVQQGTEHGKHLEWEGEDVERYYRGWFDPQTREMFLVAPHPAPGQPMRTKVTIPRILDRVLRRRFGDEFVYRAF